MEHLHPSLAQLPPELLEIIVDHLSQLDLVNCARVHRPWNTALAPYVWKIICIHTFENLTQFRTVEVHDQIRRLDVGASPVLLCGS